MPTTVARTLPQDVEKKEVKLQLTGDALISFISGTQTNIGRSTFYNLKDEQRQAMIDQHSPVLEQARPFYTLMSLPQGVNDVNRQLIAWNLIKKTLREDLKDHEHSPMTKWENEVLLQAFESIQPNRIFDFASDLKSKRVAKKRAMYLIYEWLFRNKNKWELWAIKYRKDFKNLLKHLRHNYQKAYKDPKLTKVWRYLRYNEIEGCGRIIQDYVDVQKGNQKKLAKLPSSVAEGFKKKFNLSDEDFWALFKKEGGKFTAKETRMKDAQVKRAGQEKGTNVDIRKMKLFDLLIYLKSQDNLSSIGSKAKLDTIIDEKAKVIADKMLFKLDNVGLIMDTSLSMAGTKQQPFHPMLRSMAISRVIKHVSKGFKEYRTIDSKSLFPKLKNQSDYATSIMKALKDGCKTIVIVGDGYENAPFEGAAHWILFNYKQNIDKDLLVFHFNPVFASEAMDVRALSNLAPQIGVREVGAMNESMFLAIAKQKPMLAVQGYLKYLGNLQNEKAKALMPEEIRKVIVARKQKLLEV